ncbi:hypothetical protein PoB_007109100 [Plakobranchus ocellatus]|uniref:Uncharacterized protein n=1 Tax=Plakobranchus ocellatus TaxID=259542 RepID=A0AAV4DK70_9GAST|nr:hypothetical protein PoB_007109100 [Plakobranchus ocellatus]
MTQSISAHSHQKTGLIPAGFGPIAVQDFALPRHVPLASPAHLRRPIILNKQTSSTNSYREELLSWLLDRRPSPRHSTSFLSLNVSVLLPALNSKLGCFMRQNWRGQGGSKPSPHDSRSQLALFIAAPSSLYW